MQLFVAIGGSCFLLLCIVGGVRLLLLARRTRQLPELVLGLALVFMGGIGTPAGALARAPLELSDAMRALLMGVQGLVLGLGFGAFAMFTQRVFRPEDPVARFLAWVLPAIGLAGAALMFIEPGGIAKALDSSGSAGIGLGYLIQAAVGTLVLSWTAGDALRFAMALRRRRRLGLADPVVANRVLLWGSAMVLAASMSALTTGALLVGIDVMAEPLGMAVVATFGMVAAGAIYLAFLPPLAYTRWVASRPAPSH